MSRNKNGAQNRFLHALREKHTGRDEELDELADKADALDNLQQALFGALSEEATEVYMDMVAGNRTIIQGRRQMRDGNNFPPGSAKRRSMRLNCVHKELRLIAGMDISDEDRGILQTLAGARWAFISMDDIKNIEIGSEKYEELMSDKHAGISDQMRLQSLWNGADICVIGLAGTMALLALFDGGLTIAALTKAGLWGAVGYGGHKAIENRDVLWDKFQDFASRHGVSKLQARQTYASGMAATE